jgi:hypothetical protein
MSRNTSRLDVSRTDERINKMLSIVPARAAGGGPTVCHYNRNEDQFITLSERVTVPSMPVHHPMDVGTPPPGYRDAILTLVNALIRLESGLLAGTSWYFDPVNIHEPTFYRVEYVGDTPYLYLVLIDLTCRPLECEILAAGSNSTTSEYRTDRLYFECDWFPLESASADSLEISQSIPFTWKGEAGQGYMLHGIWMDSDINKFFSKLILPAGKRNYPYYPFTCKQHCVSMNAWGMGGPRLLDEARKHIEPVLDDILSDLQANPFSELMPLFARIRSTIPESLGERWKDLTVTARLDEREQKEYTVEF